jgi:hypothetical protein
MLAASLGGLLRVVLAMLAERPSKAAVRRPMTPSREVAFAATRSSPRIDGAPLAPAPRFLNRWLDRRLFAGNFFRPFRPPA